MFNLKLKPNNQQSTSEHRKPLSPDDSKHKPKKHKEIQTKSTKALPKQATIIPIKRKTHMPSKSSLEVLENKHHKFPNLELRHHEQRKTHQFTFTHLLQQQAQNSTQSMRSQNDNISYSCNYETVKDTSNMTNKSPITKNCLTPSAFTNNSENRENQFSNLLHQKLSTIHQQISHHDTSISKEHKKSPYRVVNTNRLNNTPKIKEKSKQNKPNKVPQQQPRRFTAVLNSSMMAESQNAAQDQYSFKGMVEGINLECSEKIDKFMADKQSQTKDQKKSPRNKSNLLSTGIINLSHPLEAYTSNRPQQMSKENLNNLQVENIVSEQKIKAFSSDSLESIQNQGQYVNNVSTKLKKVKQTIGYIRKKINNKLQNQQNFSITKNIQQNYNPQINSSLDINAKISQLLKVKEQFSTAIATIIDTLNKLSLNIKHQINEQINMLKMSEATSIDWIAVATSLKQKDQINNFIMKTDILKLRVEQVESLSVSTNNGSAISLLCSQQKDLLKQLQMVEKELMIQNKKIDKFISNISIRERGKNDQCENQLNCLKEQLKTMHSIISILN